MNLVLHTIHSTFNKSVSPLFTGERQSVNYIKHYFQNTLVVVKPHKNIPPPPPTHPIPQTPPPPPKNRQQRSKISCESRNNFSAFQNSVTVRRHQRFVHILPFPRISASDSYFVVNLHDFSLCTFFVDFCEGFLPRTQFENKILHLFIYLFSLLLSTFCRVHK